MNVLCYLGLHSEDKKVYEQLSRIGRNNKRLRRSYAICKRCGKRLRWVKSHERQ